MAVVGVGKGHPGITVHILDDNGREVPAGQIGEVALDTTSRMEGYLADPKETARVFSGNLLKTGDLGYLRDGELFWTGRTRECIAYRGRKIDPSDFEAPLLKIPDLRPGCFVAFGVDDAATGTEKIVIVSEVKDSSHRSLDAVRQDVTAAVATQLGMVSLSELVMVKRGTLTKTSSGKRRHRHFRELYLRGALDQSRVGIEPYRSKKTDEFDPTSDLFVAQFSRPASVREVNLRALTPIQRALLVTDGTVTKFIEAVSMEPVEIVRLGQAPNRLRKDNPWLEVPAGSEVVARQVILRGKYSHKLHAYALSLIVSERLSEEVRRGLDLAHGALGQILLDSAVETRREVLWYGSEHIDELPPQLEGRCDGDFIVRAYRIISKGKPVMMIMERFPASSEESQFYD
jgi:chorismate-pyruvate lyase